MFYVFGAFLFGILVPYMARRFAKFMPATFAMAVVEMFRPGKRTKAYYQLKEYKKFMWHSFMSGIIAAALTWGAYWYFGSDNFGFVACFIWMLLLLAEVDYRTFLLPDILTVPLLIIGFAGGACGYGFVGVQESALGAVIGYFLPVAVSLLIVGWKKDAFGGGDIKLLAALGAWLGVEGLLYVIVTASIAGMIYALMRRKKELAFGPMLALAGIVVAFWLF